MSRHAQPPLTDAEKRLVDSWAIPPMDEALRSRLAMINAGIVEDANPDLTIHKIVLHNAAGDDDKLRTRPDVVGVIMKEAYNAKNLNELKSSLRTAAGRLQQTGAYRDFSIDLRPTEGIDPLKGGDLHVSLDEARIAANTGVTRSTSGTVEWMGEVSLANTLGYAETITAKVSQSKNDFSVTEVATGLRDRFAGSDSSANPLALEPSFELAFSKPTLLDSLFRIQGAVRGEVVDMSSKSGFRNKVREAEIGIGDPTGRHSLLYRLSLRNVIPNKDPSKYFALQASPQIVADATASMKSSFVYKYRFDTRQHTAVPNTGVLAEFVTEVAGLGGDVQFTKIEARAQQWATVFRKMPDTGFELPLHKAEWAEFRNDPSKKSAGSSSKSGLKPSANAAAKKSSEFTLAHQFAGWSAPGITMNVSGSLGVLRSFGRDANRRTGTRVIDRFFLGGPDMTGFDIAGVGPRGEAIPGGSVDGDALGGDMSAFAALRVFLPPLFPSIRLGNAGIRTQLFTCVGTLTPKPTANVTDLLEQTRLSFGAAVVIPLMSTLSLQIQGVLGRRKHTRDVDGSLMALVSLW